MFYRILLATLLILPLGGCAVYGYDHDRGYRNHAYYKGYRHDYSPPVYVTSRYYYDDRRRQYQAPPRYVPAPQPRAEGCPASTESQDTMEALRGTKANGARPTPREAVTGLGCPGAESTKTW